MVNDYTPCFEKSDKIRYCRDCLFILIELYILTGLLWPWIMLAISIEVSEFSATGWYSF